MLESTTTHGAPRTRLNCEQLEARENPSGNVSVFLSGGSLFVIGDGNHNAATTRQDSSGNIVIAGVSGTTINGQSVIVLPPIVPFNAVFDGGFGFDQIDISGLQVANNLRVAGGPGNDLVTIRDGTSSAFMNVTLDDGNDTLIGHNIVARVGAQFSGGFGFDRAQLRNFVAGNFFFHNTIEQFV
jgi:hypothetical protein